MFGGNLAGFLIQYCSISGHVYWLSGHFKQMQRRKYTLVLYSVGMFPWRNTVLPRGNGMGNLYRPNMVCLVLDWNHYCLSDYMADKRINKENRRKSK